MARSGFGRQSSEKDDQRVEAHAWIMLALLCAIQCADVIGTTIMIVALPSIRVDLGMSGSALELAVAIYALVFGGLIVITGRLSDMYGARRLCLLGLAVFCAAALLCGRAVSPAMLIGARALEGLGTALAMPAALTMVTDVFREGPLRHKALGIWTASAAAGGALGFSLGGVITEMAGWRWIFLLNLPVGLLALAALPRLMGNRWNKGNPRQQVNPLGAVFLISSLFALLYGLTRSKEEGIASLPVIAILAGGMILLAAFVITERRSASPLIPPDLLRSRALTGSALVAFALTATTGAAGVLLTLFFQGEIGLSPSRAGAMLAPFSLAVVLGSMAGARLTDRFGFRASMSIGLAGVATAMLVDAYGVGAGSLPYLVSGFCLSGAALGCASVASTAGGLSLVDEDRRGLASGILNSTTKIGTSLGIALIPAVGAAWIGTGSLTEAASSSSLSTGFQAAFVTAAAVAVLAIPVAWSSFTGGEASRDGTRIDERPALE